MCKKILLINSLHKANLRNASSVELGFYSFIAILKEARSESVNSIFSGFFPVL